MLDLAQHRCSAAAKNQVGVSVSEHVCECGVWGRIGSFRENQRILDVMARIKFLMQPASDVRAAL